MTTSTTTRPTAESQTDRSLSLFLMCSAWLAEEILEVRSDGVRSGSDRPVGAGGRA